MIRPIELAKPRAISFDGHATTTTDVWETLLAARNGDLARVRQLVAANPVLACCKYNYAPPIHFAVREGHIAVVRFLLDHGGLFPNYRSDRFRESLPDIARRRRHHDVIELLEAIEHNPRLAMPCISPTDDLRIELENDDGRIRLRELIDRRLRGEGTLEAIETTLAAEPWLATDELQYWGEGVLALPAKEGDRELVELLMRYGARVPVVSNWCARYAAERADMLAFLLERGMDPNHMTWQRVTLLHEMAFFGDVTRATVLLDHRAQIDPIDDEFRMTPLALAISRDQQAMVALLIDRGAKPGTTGSSPG